MIYAAAPATWGLDTEVPDTRLYLTLLWSLGSREGETIGENAAKMFNPGAVISGFSIFNITKTEISPKEKNRMRECIPSKYQE